MPEKLPRILHGTVSLGYGGMEMMLARLIEADRGIREHWVVGLMADTSPDPADSYTSRLEALGARVFSLDVPRGGFSLRGLVRLWRIHRTCRPMLLSGWSYHGNLMMALLSRFSAADAAVLNIRSDLPNLASAGPGLKLLLRLNAMASRFADCTIYNSRHALEAHTQFGFSPARATVIANGFDTNRFAPDPKKRQAMRARLEIADTDIACGLVGRLDPLKDHATFLKAAAIATRQNSKLVFVAAGQGTETISGDAKFRPLLQAFEASRLKLLGHVGDMPALHNALDICVLSSTSEGFPNVLGEAMACGVPCAATDVGDVALLVGDTGLVCRPSDPEDLARAILTLAAADRHSLGEAARRRIVESFSVSRAHDAFSKSWEDCTTPTERALACPDPVA